jgi:hypothetical protein
MAPSRSRSSEQLCRGMRPSQDANSRADRDHLRWGLSRTARLPRPADAWDFSKRCAASFLHRRTTDLALELNYLLSGLPGIEPGRSQTSGPSCADRPCPVVGSGTGLYAPRQVAFGQRASGPAIGGKSSPNNNLIGSRGLGQDTEPIRLVAQRAWPVLCSCQSRSASARGSILASCHQACSSPASWSARWCVLQSGTTH